MGLNRLASPYTDRTGEVLFFGDMVECRLSSGVVTGRLGIHRGVWAIRIPREWVGIPHTHGQLTEVNKAAHFLCLVGYQELYEEVWRNCRRNRSRQGAV